MNQTIPATHKVADKQSITDAAKKLIAANGSTTNLDIKNELRANNFWVSQDEVSNAMRTIASEENFDRTWANGFNTWSIPAAPVVQDATQDATTATNVISTPTVTPTGNNTNDVIEAIARKLGIYKQAINVKSDLTKDLGFIDRDFDTIGQVFGKDIKSCKTVQDIINLI